MLKSYLCDYSGAVSEGITVAALEAGGGENGKM